MKTDKLYGLIGNPLTHSFSKKYFTDKFQKENIHNTKFELFPLSNLTELPDLLNTYSNLLGFSVTIPFKEKVIAFLDDIDEMAKSVGAVNAVKIIRQNNDSKPHLIGYNTDVFGFNQSLKPFLEINHEKALIIGTGGASKAVEYVLKEFGITCNFVSRNPKKENHIRYSSLNESIIKSHLLIINTSPVGTFPNINEFPNIPYEFLNEKHFLYDLVYNPAETLFLKKGKQMGSFGINGYSMLQIQAEKAWELWNS